MNFTCQVSGSFLVWIAVCRRTFHKKNGRCFRNSLGKAKGWCEEDPTWNGSHSITCSIWMRIRRMRSLRLRLSDYQKENIKRRWLANNGAFIAASMSLGVLLHFSWTYFRLHQGFFSPSIALGHPIGSCTHHGDKVARTPSWCWSRRGHLCKARIWPLKCLQLPSPCLNRKWHKDT